MKSVIIKAAMQTETKPYMWAVWLILSFLLFGCFPLSPFGDQIPIGDQVIYITIAKWMNEGLVMYRDMFDHKGLAIYWFNMAGLRIGGLTGVWILTCIWTAVSTWLSYRICRLFAGEKASFLASVLFILFTTRTGSNDSPEMVSMPFVAAGMLVLLKSWYERRIPSFTESFVATFSLGIIFLLKPNIGAGVAVLVLIHCIRLCKQFDTKASIRCITGGIIGFAIPVGCAIYYIISNNAWDDYVSTFWMFNMEYSATYTLAQRIASAFKLGVYYPPTAIMWIFFAVIVPIMIKEKEWYLLWPILLVHVSLFIFDLNMSGWPSGLYLLPLFPIYVIYVARFFEWASGYIRYGGFTIIGLYSCYIAFRSALEYKGCDPWWPKDTTSKDIAQYIEQRTNSDDTVVLYNCSIAPYILTDRHSPSKYLYQSPIFDIRPSMKDDFFADIKAKLPKVMIIPNECIATFPQDILCLYIKDETSISNNNCFILKQ